MTEQDKQVQQYKDQGVIIEEGHYINVEAPQEYKDTIKKVREELKLKQFQQLTDSQKYKVVLTARNYKLWKESEESDVNVIVENLPDITNWRQFERAYSNIPFQDKPKWK